MMYKQHEKESEEDKKMALINAVLPNIQLRIKGVTDNQNNYFISHINKAKPDLRLVMRIPEVEERYQDNPAFLCDFVKDGTIIALV